jgi:hypothetical protein
LCARRAAAETREGLKCLRSFRGPQAHLASLIYWSSIKAGCVRRLSGWGGAAVRGESGSEHARGIEIFAQFSWPTGASGIVDLLEQYPDEVRAETVRLGGSGCAWGGRQGEVGAMDLFAQF